LSIFTIESREYFDKNYQRKYKTLLHDTPNITQTDAAKIIFQEEKKAGRTSPKSSYIVKILKNQKIPKNTEIILFSVFYKALIFLVICQ
jgi:hypothetical protein